MFLKKISEFLKKIQGLPEEKRKIIVWAITILIGFLLFFAWFYSLKTNLKTFEKEKFFEQIGVPELQEELKKMPKIEIPEIETPELSGEELKELERLMEEAKETEFQNIEE